MNILFLVESLENETAQNLVSEFKNVEHHVDIIPYFSHNENQCSIKNIRGMDILVFDDQVYIPQNYDAALLWCWGTASLGRKYLRIFEDQGVHVLNSTYDTEITDSKIQFANVLKNADAPTPKTLCFPSNTCIDDLSHIEKQLGKPPYVFKPDYGTQGFEVHFAFSEQDIQLFAENLRSKHPKNHGFIVQEFIGNPNEVISHYRVLVIGENVLPGLIKITAQNKMNVSNIAAGAHAELEPIHNELKKVALHAASASKLNVAGVDIMVKPGGKKEDIVILEVNDGPGTKTFDRKGINASKTIIDFFIDSLESQKPVEKTQRVVTLT